MGNLWRFIRPPLSRAYHLVFRENPYYYLGWCVWQLLGTTSRRDRHAANFFGSLSAQTRVHRWLFRYIQKNSSKEAIRAFLWQGQAGANWHRTQLQRYTDDIGPFMRQRTDLMEQVLRFISTNHYSHVVEVGCSNGHTIEHIAGRSPAQVKFVGIDINQPTITANASRWDGSSVEYRCCTLEEYLRSVTPQRAIVFALGTFAYLTETEMLNVLRSLTQVVTKGALLLYERFAELPAATWSVPAPDQFASFHNYPSLLERFGFQNVTYQLSTDKGPTDLHITLYATWDRDHLRTTDGQGQ